MPAPIAIIAGIVLAVAIMILVVRSRRSNDGVDSFRRQIDALSPEARRPVIDQMYGAADRPEPRIEPRIEPHPSAATERADSDDSDGSDGEQHDEGDVHGA